MSENAAAARRELESLKERGRAEHERGRYKERDRLFKRHDDLALKLRGIVRPIPPVTIPE